jgi:hypothetical protein
MELVLQLVELFLNQLARTLSKFSCSWYSCLCTSRPEVHRRVPVTDSCITAAKGLKLMKLFLQLAELLLQQLSVFLFQDCSSV